MHQLIQNEIDVRNEIASRLLETDLFTGVWIDRPNAFKVDDMPVANVTTVLSNQETNGTQRVSFLVSAFIKEEGDGRFTTNADGFCKPPILDAFDKLRSEVLCALDGLLFDCAEVNLTLGESEISTDAHRAFALARFFISATFQVDFTR